MLVIAVLAIASLAATSDHGIEAVRASWAASCSAGDNLGETARSFIGRCCKGSINAEFPGELYESTIGAIRSGSSATHKNAWKLLNDNRFKK